MTPKCSEWNHRKVVVNVRSVRNRQLQIIKKDDYDVPPAILQNLWSYPQLLSVVYKILITMEWHTATVQSKDLQSTPFDNWFDVLYKWFDREDNRELRIWEDNSVVWFSARTHLFLFTWIVCVFPLLPLMTISTAPSNSWELFSILMLTRTPVAVAKVWWQLNR